LAEIESPCTILYRPLIVTFAVFNRFGDIAGFYTPRANCVSMSAMKYASKCAGAKYIGLIKIMHPAILHDVESLLSYLVIFCCI